MRKILAILLVATCLVGTCTACGPMGALEEFCSGDYDSDF